MVKQKKVTFFISTLSGGGAESVCINIANELSKKDWDVTIVILNLKNTDYIDRINNRVQLISLNVSKARYAFFELRKFIKKNKIKKVIAFDYVMVILLVIIKMTIIKKYKIIFRNINTLSSKINATKTFKQYIIYSLLKKIFYKVDYIINQCKGMQDDLLEILNLNQKKNIIIYNPVNKIIENASIESSHIVKEDYFLCIGRLEKQKSFDTAIEAFAIFSKTHPTYRLKIVGKGSLEKDLRVKVNSLNIQNKVDFEGFQANVIEYYKKARATLLTSLYEGFPNVLIESITLGTPVISLDIPSGPREIIVKGVNGYLVENKDLEAFSSSMIEIIENKMDVKMVIESSKQYYLDNIIVEWEELLLSMD